MTKTISPTYGDIYFVDFDPSLGNEFQGKRPAVVIQSNEQLKKSNLITVMPFTSNIKRITTDDIVVQPSKENVLYQASALKVFSIYSFDRMRFIKKIGILDAEVLKKVKDYLRIHFSI